ncbi:MAG: hypothetical protein RLN72_13840 [Henriciella sp.]
MRFLTTALAAGLLVMTGACQPRERTVFPAIEGVAVDVSTGWGVEGAWVSGDRTDETATTDDEGRFALALVKAADTRIPLPVSGVYRDTVGIEAQVDGARAYGPADFISIDEAATSPVTLFLMGHEAAYASETIPEGCELTDVELYALQMLALEDKAVLRDALAEDSEYAFAFEAWMDRTIVRRMAKRCDISTAQSLAWIDMIDALSPH